MCHLLQDEEGIEYEQPFSKSQELNQKQVCYRVIFFEKKKTLNGVSRILLHNQSLRRRVDRSPLILDK